jgi:hypothetical protein
MTKAQLQSPLDAIPADVRLLAAEVNAHRQMRADLVKWWRFDDWQQPQSSWHERNEMLAAWDRRVEEAKAEIA